MISEKANLIGTSPTLKITAKAKAMRAEGIDVVDFSAGETDFPTPEHIKAAGIKAIQQNFTKYTENEGTPALKRAIVASLKEDYGLDYKPNEVIVSTGAKSSLFHLLQALINEEEEVIIPSPYWVTYPQSVMLAKGNRSSVVKDSCKKYGGFYLGSIGGVAALMAKECITHVELLEYPELGMEAIYLITVKDFPAFIITDDKGNDFFEKL